MTSQSDQVLTVELNGRIFRINKGQRLSFFKNNDSSGDEPLGSKNKTDVYIPNATFKILRDDRKPNFKLTTEYIQYNGCEAEIDEDRIEYDMDNEDTTWLTLANEHRKQMGWSQIGEETFERAIDRLEKESHFQIATGADKNPYFPQIDNDAACCICNDAEDSNVNQIIFCDMCNIPAHQECYGVPYIPEGQWLCRRCQLSPSVPVSCALCPYAFGAFKQTTCGRWAHVICALWLNEVHFANVVFNEPIEGISYALKRREKLRCIVCRQKTGACLQCSARVCRASFHVTCGFFAGFYMEVKSEPARNSAAGAVIRHAYCPKHYPESKRPKVSENVWKRMVNRKILQAKTQVLSTAQEAPQISVPVIPSEKIEAIQRELKLDEIQDICYYWALKRRSRFGVPLIRRLQVYQTLKTLKRAEDPNRTEKELPASPSLAISVPQPLAKAVSRRGRRGGGAAASTARRGRGASSAVSPYTSQTQSPMPQATAAGSKKQPPMIRSLGIGGGVIVGCVAEGIEPIAEQVHVLRLRANLERIRLLCELVKKREKHKRAFIRLTEAIFDRWLEVTSVNTLDHFVSKDGDHSGATELIFQQLSHLTLIRESDLAASELLSFGKKHEPEGEDDGTAFASLLSRGRKQSAFQLSSISTTTRRRGSPTARRKAGVTRRGGKVSTLPRDADESLNRKRKLRIDDFFAAVSSRVSDEKPSTSFASPASSRSLRGSYRDTKANLCGGRSPRLRGDTTMVSDVSADEMTATSMEDDDDVSEILDPSSPALFSHIAAMTPNRRGGGATRRRRGTKRESFASTRSPDVSSTSDGLQRNGIVELEGRSAKRKRRTLPGRIKFNEFDSGDPNLFTHNDIVWARSDEADGQQMPARVIDLRMRAFLDDDLPVDKALRARPSTVADRPHMLVVFFDAAKTWKWIPVDRLSPCDLSSPSKGLNNNRSPCEAALKRARQFWKEMLCE